MSAARYHIYVVFVGKGALPSKQSDSLAILRTGIAIVKHGKRYEDLPNMRYDHIRLILTLLEIVIFGKLAIGGIQQTDHFSMCVNAWCKEHHQFLKIVFQHRNTSPPHVGQQCLIILFGLTRKGGLGYLSTLSSYCRLRHGNSARMRRGDTHTHLQALRIR